METGRLVSAFKNGSSAELHYSQNERYCLLFMPEEVQQELGFKIILLPESGSKKVSEV